VNNNNVNNNNVNNNNANAGNDRNENIINNINNNYPGAGNPHPIHYQEVFPLPLHNEMLRMLYELRVPLYALGAMGGGGGGAAADDYMEQEAGAVLARSLYDARPVKNVLDIPDGESGEKNGIREMAYDPETAEELKINTTCGIWQEDFEPGEAIKILPCNHAFKAEAITTWLTTEKAECPICRFKLKSKEVIMHPPASEVRAQFNGNAYVYDDDNVDDDDDDDDLHNAPQPQDQPQPPVDEQRARENNIIYRQNNIIYNRAHRGGIADMGRDVYHGMSMPMSQLIQMRGRLVHGGRAARAAAAGSSGGVAAAAAIPLSQPSQVSQPQPSVTNINNYYINRINQYHISAEEQEEADIEEAIRRSLE
jgi:hypothetical protein